MALSLQELMAAWVAVATVTLSEYRRQCWRLAGLTCSGVVEALDEQGQPTPASNYIPHGAKQCSPMFAVRQKCSIGSCNGQCVRKKLVFG